MSQKKYWKGLEELEDSPELQEMKANEFREMLPFEDVSDSMLAATTPRRDFLKYLGFSTAAAMLAASCEMPVRKVIPYAIKPEDITPGVANYYASTFVDGGDYCAVVIKSRDGRPIKIEGNTLSSVTRGGTSARVQASILSLYDKARLRGPYADGKMADTFQSVDRQIMAGLNSGKINYILTNTILSPSLLEVINRFIAKYPNTRHVTYDAMSATGMLLANEASYGKRALPSYHFDRADTIVSLDADFLGGWLSPVEYAKQYGTRRKVSAKNPVMSRHYQIEGIHTISGASADERATAKPSEMGAVAVALYNAVAGGATPNFKSAALNKLITKAAADLKRGNGLVVCGSNDVNVQTVVNAINSAIGANGATIDWTATSNYRKGLDGEMAALVADMNAGRVGTLIVHGANPVYEYYDSKAVVDGMAKVPVTVSLNERMDETTEKCKFIVPDHHYLESWGDAEPKTGYYSLMQPGIAPLFKTRSFADSLFTWAEAPTTYAEFWRSYWVGKLGSESMLDKALQDGVIEPAGAATPALQGAAQIDTASNGGTTRPATLGGATFAGNVNGAITAIAALKPSNDVELVVYQKVGIGHGGCWSNNPWLQEMPDPITKATWDNYICISPARARLLDQETGEPHDLEKSTINQVQLNMRMVTVKANGKEITLPAIVVPGMHNDVVAIAVGYGRSAGVGRAAADTGKNAYPFLASNGTTFVCYSPASIAKAAGRYEVAVTQTHNSYEGRDNIIQEFTLDEFKQDPGKLLKIREGKLGHYAHKPWLSHHEDAAHGAAGAAALPGGGIPENTQQGNDELSQGFRENGTLYPNYVSPGIHWGMSIDLNSCIGCGACVIGCQAENNVSVVGKAEVMKAQEMHWITIDRYFTGDPQNPDTIQTIFQPMLCQHCDNAPCENVCPVSATNHSSEGLNQMAYNRCIGTKYCANNCPYKVRRFNWFDWNGADCFADNLYEDGRRDDINDDLTRMVLNPDVTVRSRGVMEKCTFCVQRLQDAKLDAKQAGHPMQDGAARTACQQACPTDAILFGDVNDKNSAIYKLRTQDQRERLYYVLEEIHTLPNVNYLAKIRNTDHVMSGSEQDIMTKESI